MSSAPPAHAPIHGPLSCTLCGTVIGTGFLTARPRLPARSDAEKMELILDILHRLRLPLYEFLRLAFAPHRQHVGEGRNRTHAQAVSSFLGGRDDVSVRAIVQQIYDHHDSQPVGHAVDVERKMARAQLLDWAYDVTVDQFAREATALTDIRTGDFLRMSKAKTSWDRIHEFSLVSIRDNIALTAPHIWRSFLMLATPTRTLRAAHDVGAVHNDPTKPTPALSAESRAEATSKRRHEPWIIALFAIAMLMVSRNLHVNFFQKVISVWLFANSAPYDMYGILCRFGLALSYSGTLGIMRRLAHDSGQKARLLAHSGPFGIIYDNINRLRRRYTALFGQQDEMQNGTASIIMRMVNFVWTAVDLRSYFRARSEHRRAALSLSELEARIPTEHLKRIFIAHSLDILVQHTPSLSVYHDRVMEMFRVDLALNRLHAHQPTEYYPMATSDCNVGTTPGTRDALDDIFVRQLEMDPRVVANLLRIVCGDQGSIEKLRTLKRYLQSCPHGYAQYDWVYPLVQLWHMGWADMARVLKTHWGADESDESGFNAIIQAIGSKVKKKDRPDHRPTLRLMTQTLHGDILSCWRQVLSTDDLDVYFTSHSIGFPELVKLAELLHSRYLSSAAEERARAGGELRDPDLTTGPTANGKRSAAQPTDAKNPNEHRASSSRPSRSLGDGVLADWMLRLRDCLLQIEFQYAVADGDIGRVLAVISVWVFMFAGCGATKYTTELVELICQLEYELPPELRDSILGNWLANPTGRSGGWVPLDLMLERLIRMLKKLADRRDTTFGADFYRRVVSPNIRGLLRVKDDLRAALGIGPRSKRHGSQNDSAVQVALALFNTEHHLPHFCEGRGDGTTARNDFQTGHARLREGRLAEIIQTSLYNIPPSGQEMPLHDDVSEGAGTEDEESDSDFNDENSDSSGDSSFSVEESSDESDIDADGDTNMRNV
ncbi:hypothetical protein EXIGLDRAFT_840603 [Exidia glandulosa HHB12029]|uniref:DUF6589 domain-containing protein n=1 Tax=Exidia glandulosa HHB12029 TaxID=1314781 RepID=A0A165ECQ0_EXIGL|nr:hypothetical protein EXIGLDRAFT_840603 [Exidia glandulosa HHB12029]